MSVKTSPFIHWYSMSSTLQIFYSHHQAKWSTFVKNDVRVEGLLAEKCDQLLLSKDELNVVSGLNMLLSFSGSGLVRLLESAADEYVLTQKYLVNQFLLERCLCRFLSDPASDWYEGWSLGYFDGMLFRSSGYTEVGRLSSGMKRP